MGAPAPSLLVQADGGPGQLLGKEEQKKLALFHFFLSLFFLSPRHFFASEREALLTPSLSRKSIYLVFSGRRGPGFDRCAACPVIRAERDVPK